MLWQMWVKLWRGGGVFAIVGLPQTRQPGVSQVGAALGQPQLALDQGDHCQVVDRRHVPDMHQAFGLGQLGEGFGKVATAPFEIGDHAVADQHTDVAASPGFSKTGAQTGEPGFGLEAHQQQKTLVER